MNSPSSHNPYAPPKSDLTPPSNSQDSEFIAGGQYVSAGNAFGWVGFGWSLFMKSPGIWILNCIILFALMIVIGIVPVLGGIASQILNPIFIGGMFLGCKALDGGESLEVAHIFAGFKDKAGKLALVGVLMLATMIAVVVVCVILLIILFGTALFQSGGDPQALASVFAGKGVLVILLFVLGALALFIPVSMAYWFAPALVVLQGLDPIQAMKQSFIACLKNFIPFLVYGFVMLVLLIIACIPLGLGLFVFAPLAYCIWYTSYKDIFLRE